MTTPAPALPVLKDLANDSGLEPKVLQLLLDHGVTNSGAFFHTFQEPAAVKKLLHPTTLGDGVKLSTGTSVKLDDVQFLVATSVFAHMVDEVRVARAARVAATTTTAASAATTAAAVTTKVPKTLPDNYWADFLAEYQSETIGGIARQFPTHLLSGADEVLARLVHERVTRSFSPLRLGEIVAHRQFTVSGQINPFRIKEDPGSRLVLTEDGQFDRAPKRVPEPQKLQTFLDFLESVKLGLLFARWGPEIHLDHWVGWFANLVRDHPTKYPHLRELYVRSSWSLCMKMRDGTSFAIAHREVIDNTSVSEALARHLPPDSKGKGDKGGKGDHKGKSKQPPHDPRRTRSGPYKPSGGAANTGQGSSGAPQCRLFAAGHCKFGSSCKFAHGTQHAVPPRPQAPAFPSA